MFYLEKTAGKDFIILNVTDMQLSSHDWEYNRFACKTVTHTIGELVVRVKPDLLTISGDLSYPGQAFSYQKFAEYLDTFRIPWSLVWGNHDQKVDPSCLDETEKIMRASKYLLYERGDENLGFGNFVIAVTEKDKIAEAIFMVDTHDEEFATEGGERVRLGWARWSEA